MQSIDFDAFVCNFVCFNKGYFISAKSSGKRIVTDKPVEVGRKVLVLNDTVFLKISFCESHGELSRDAPGIVQHGITSDFKNQVYTLSPILYWHWDVTYYHPFRHVKPGVDESPHIFQIGLFQMILGNAYVKLHDFLVCVILAVVRQV